MLNYHFQVAYTPINGISTLGHQQIRCFMLGHKMMVSVKELMLTEIGDFTGMMEGHLTMDVLTPIMV